MKNTICAHSAATTSKKIIYGEYSVTTRLPMNFRMSACSIFTNSLCDSTEELTRRLSEAFSQSTNSPSPHCAAQYNYYGEGDSVVFK